MPALPLGRYLILVATDKNFTYVKNAVGYGKTWVSNISYVRREMGKNAVQFYALHRETGHPLSGIDVEVFVQRYIPDDREYKFFEVASGETNNEGLFEFKKEENQYNNYKVVFTDYYVSFE